MKDTFVQPRDWPQVKKYFGIAHAWPGAAWVAFQLDASGILPLNGRVTTMIRNQLKHRQPVRYKNLLCTSHLIGSGSYAVIAALMAARGEAGRALFHDALTNWMRDCEQPGQSDVMLGSAGAILACTEIETVIPAQIPLKFLKKLRQDVIAQMEKSLAGLNECNPIFLGFSHGIAGYLFALEMCDFVFGLKFQHSLRTDCFDAITANRLRLGKKAMVWPDVSGQDSVGFHSWCHGGPGIALALLYSYKITGLDAYREIAEEALEGTFQLKTEPNGFCCGSTGRAQILIEAFRVIDNTGWLKKAKQVAAAIELPQEKSRYNRGFHAGRLGYDYLLWRLKHPKPLPLPALGIFSSGDFH